MSAVQPIHGDHRPGVAVTLGSVAATAEEALIWLLRTTLLPVLEELKSSSDCSAQRPHVSRPATPSSTRRGAAAVHCNSSVVLNTAFLALDGSGDAGLLGGCRRAHLMAVVIAGGHQPVRMDGVDLTEPSRVLAPQHYPAFIRATWLAPAERAVMKSRRRRSRRAHIGYSFSSSTTSLHTPVGRIGL